MNAACVPYAPGNNSKNSGKGYWVATDKSHVYTFGAAHYYGDPAKMHLNQPLIGGESVSTGTGYWLLALDGGIFTFGGRPLPRLDRRDAPEPADQRDGTHLRTTGATGSWRTTAGSSRSATPGSTARPARCTSTSRCSGWSARARARATGCSRGTVGSSPSATPSSTARSARSTRLVADRRHAAHGDGQGLLDALAERSRLRLRRRRKRYGDIAGCSNYGGANRLLVSPTGKGYWIATADGSVISFGDAKRLGFPVSIDGQPIALMGAG